jgi:hypothetical protein
MITARTAASRSSVGARASSPKRARRGRSRRGRSFLILAACAASLLAPSHAGAARSEFYGIAQGPKIDATDIQGMAGVKVHTVRFLVEWRYAEPSPGTFRWGGTDSKIGSLAARGIGAVPFVWGCPTWAGCSGPSRPPVDSAAAIQAWQSFLKALVGRYGPGGSYWSNGYRQQYPGAAPLPVHSWQVWNEPNLTKYLDPGGTVGQAALKYAPPVALLPRRDQGQGSGRPGPGTSSTGSTG